MPDDDTTTDETTKTDAPEAGEKVEADAKPDANDENASESDDEQKPDDASKEGKQSKLSHEDALTALEKTRRENASWRTKFRDLEKRLEDSKTSEEVTKIVDEMKAEAAARDRALVVENVALKFNLPDDLAAVLNGESREDLEAHARVLQKYAHTESEDEGNGGLDPSESNEAFDPEALVKDWRKNRY